MYIDYFNSSEASDNSSPELMSVQLSDNKQPSICAICSGSATCRHFGAFSCNACAAFFRRSIAKKRTYCCVAQNNCNVNFKQVRRMCAACRFNKCISAGMQESEVLSVRVSPERKNKDKNIQLSEETLPATSYDLVPVLKLQKFDHSSQFSSFQNNDWLRQLLISTKSIEHQRISHLPPSPYPFRKISYMPNVAKQIFNETHFCQMFLNATDICNAAGDIVVEKFTDIIYNWNYLMLVLNTLKFDSLQDGNLTAIDHSTIEMSESSLKAWYATMPLYRTHLDSIVRISSPTWYNVADLITKIHNLHMTNEEQAFFLFLGMIEGITRLTSEPKVTRLRFQPLLDSAFRSMHTYYQENFPSDCTATRMGNLIMAMPIMDEINKLFAEQRIMMSLCHSNLQMFSTASLLNKFRLPVKR